MNTASWPRRLIAGTLLLPLAALASPPAGLPDPSFGDGDPEFPGAAMRGFDFDGITDDTAIATVKDAQGRIVIAGFGSSENTKCLGLMRFSADGVPDKESFGPNQNNVTTGRICHGKVLGQQLQPFVLDLDLALQPDGKLLVSGITMHDGDPAAFTCRFLDNGQLDTTFNPFGTQGCLQPDGVNEFLAAIPRILVNEASIFMILTRATGNNTLAPWLARMSLADGSPQPFGQNVMVPMVTHLAADIVLASLDAALTDSGDILIAGNLAQAQTNAYFVARFDPIQGLPRTSFGDQGRLSFDFDVVPDGLDTATSIEVLPDDRLLIAGTVENTSHTDIGVVQLQADSGDPEPSFNGGVPLVYPACKGLQHCKIDYLYLDAARSPSGKIVFGGSIQLDEQDGQSRMFAARLNADGSPDSTFGSQNGLALAPGFGAAMMLQDEKVILSGAMQRTTTAFIDTDNDGIGDEIVQIEHSDVALLRLGDGWVFRDGFEGVAP